MTSPEALAEEIEAGGTSADRRKKIDTLGRTCDRVVEKINPRPERRDNEGVEKANKYVQLNTHPHLIR